MAYVITQSCCSDAACVAVCPVNCIHPTPDEPGFGTSDILHVDPEACIDCGACADACPVNAIFPADRLSPRDRIFIEINADYYRDNPQISSGWSEVVYPELPRLPEGLRVAVVGTGPSGGYALRTLLNRTRAAVTVIDKLPTPGGLVRAGVAPDHPSTKDVMRTFDLLYRDPRVTMATNVEVGDDVAAGQITPAELAEHFDAVFYAVGAAQSRTLGIEGEDLPGSTSATDLVAWYNAVPGADGIEIVADGSGRAVIVGTGNVALDIARILVSPPELLAVTDIADRALELLRRQDVHEVVLLGRRGQDQAAYTSAEYRALSVIPGVQVEGYDDADGPLPDLSGPADPGRRRIVFLFHTTPVRAGGDERVQEVTASTGGREYPIATDLLVRSIGYRAAPIGGLPFDHRAGHFPNDGGRMIDPDGGDAAPLPGVYVLGWAGRGSTGGIGANKLQAIQTVERFIDDAAAERLDRPVSPPEAFDELLRRRRRTVVGYRGIRAIDRRERQKGAQQGRPRVKFTEVSEMLGAAGRRRR
ncbi:putative ferredoxin--NADP(+) reductase [Gordonia hirsuta DSM 44140 = NBRC 16056]|uniref:ferredoxin--NADP(+) reductase n=1 Tax=Gordonia hirsuta DSM 44140 = NBRC 16056 TaxID=1121927 RepID=L7LBS9_9ACTN|nr:FAD-dependent oxidoreductase [Gordonia hirsuta]GAC57468.1 putative ferredoxin--NADP(+) reductase [Gordonia hirsuta DSM 44140 = NBRC 16056]